MSHEILLVILEYPGCIVKLQEYVTEVTVIFADTVLEIPVPLSVITHCTVNVPVCEQEYENDTELVFKLLAKTVPVLFFRYQL